jgi:hypothetical protein
MKELLDTLDKAAIISNKTIRELLDRERILERALSLACKEMAENIQINSAIWAGEVTPQIIDPNYWIKRAGEL